MLLVAGEVEPWKGRAFGATKVSSDGMGARLGWGCLGVV
jgi:hypothetical protein